MGIGEIYTDVTPFNGSYRPQRELVGHQKGVRCACSIGTDYLTLLSDEGIDMIAISNVEYLVSGGTEGEVIIWKLDKSGGCDLHLRFMAHINTVMCICPSKLTNDFFDQSDLENDNKKIRILESKLCIYTSGRDKLIHRFNLAGKKLLTLEGHNDAVCSLHEMSDPSKLVSGSWDGTAIVWNVLSGTKEYVLPCDGYQYSVYVKTAVDREIITGMQNGDICFWRDATLVNRKKIHNDAVRSINLCNGILTSSNDCTIKLHTKSLDLVYTIEQHGGFIYDVCKSRSFNVIFSASEDKTVRVWNLENGQHLQTLSLESSIWQVVETEFNGIATIESTGRILLWSLEPGKEHVNDQIPVSKPSKRIEHNKLYDMTLFKKFNSEKAHELLKEYNGKSGIVLTAQELIYLDKIFQKDIMHSKLSSSDSTWIIKLIQWPVIQRLPVFDLIKALASYHITEQLFRGRNNGSSIIISACDTLLSTESNVQLLTVTLQMLSNLLYPSLSRNLILCHSKKILESVQAVTNDRSRMIQQALAAFSQNFVIALIYNNDRAAITHVIELIERSLKVCNDLLAEHNSEYTWADMVILKHSQSLDMIIKNNLISKTDISENMFSIMTSLNGLINSHEKSDFRCSKLVKCIIEQLR